ncbi:nucleotidyl transferase AbiEii/AbiGii toxin family protein [Roseburia sp. 499]|uniref:nucleotidyl transferase AbiEii/AbiGii toxin family protein n=1 Tax=Roseburia sp. 499 TaxID=1261634 RepID=UPI001FA81F88|nr:nucleotidyl transferase AbiEii/AbiGii toxin family protein [Roseburia sp. 499]WVK69421.1 nucleotidyl transferase AbiEii/AbiGii toxin family protein [Roseburia sp. 499]
MMYLHKEDIELFQDIIITVSEKSGIEENIVEKDYYVTLLLKELAKRNSGVVFKGGTSLSKAYHVIERFSEDIDITFCEHIGVARKKKIKYELLKPISEKLGLPIDNWDMIESNKDYNHYDFLYDTMSTSGENVLRPYIKLETALMSYSYPTEEREITSIIYENLKDTEPEIIKEYGLGPFMMNTQSLIRTFIDKLFAVCDYYMNGKPTRNSRHLYDIYKLYSYITIDEKFYNLMRDVREHRANMDIKITPSARADVDIVYQVEKMIQSEFYLKDYENSTMKLIGDDIGYEEVLQCYSKVMHELF